MAEGPPEISPGDRSTSRCGNVTPPAADKARDFATRAERWFNAGDERATAAATISIAFGLVASHEQHDAAMGRAERIAETLRAVGEPQAGNA